MLHGCSGEAAECPGGDGGCPSAAGVVDDHDDRLWHPTLAAKGKRGIGCCSHSGAARRSSAWCCWSWARAAIGGGTGERAIWVCRGLGHRGKGFVCLVMERRF